MAVYKKNLYDNKLDAYMIVSMVVQMIQDGNLKLTRKDKMKLTDNESVQTYNQCLCYTIAEMEKAEISLKELIDKLCLENKQGISGARRCLPLLKVRLVVSWRKLDGSAVQRSRDR